MTLEDIEIKNYEEILSRNAEANFQKFRTEVLQKLPLEIFEDSHKINIYNQIYCYFTESQNLSNEVYEFLCKDGDKVIDIFYKTYLNGINSINFDEWDDITYFIESEYACSQKPTAKNKETYEL